MKSLWDKNPWPRKFQPAIIWFSVIIILLSIPGSDLPEAPSFFSEIYLDKWIHAFLFGVLTIFICRPLFNRRSGSDTFLRRCIYVVATVSAFGILTEILQGAFIPRREFDIYDWLADTAGAAVGFFDALQLKSRSEKNGFE